MEKKNEGFSLIAIFWILVLGICLGFGSKIWLTRNDHKGEQHGPKRAGDFIVNRAR